jgi:hypothetical protein
VFGLALEGDVSGLFVVWVFRFGAGKLEDFEKPGGYHFEGGKSRSTIAACGFRGGYEW